MVKKSHSSFQRSVFSMAMVAMFIALYGVLSLLHIYITKDLRIETYIHAGGIGCNDVWPHYSRNCRRIGRYCGLADKPGWQLFSGVYSKRICFGSHLRSVFVQKGNYVEKDCFLRSCNGIYRGSRPEPGMVEYYVWHPVYGVSLVKACQSGNLNTAAGVFIYSTKDLVKKFAPAR